MMKRTNPGETRIAWTFYKAGVALDIPNQHGTAADTKINQLITQMSELINDDRTPADWADRIRITVG